MAAPDAAASPRPSPSRTALIRREVLDELEAHRAAIDGPDVSVVIITINMDRRTRRPENVVTQVTTRRAVRADPR
jgi:hypothetical protein